MAIGVELAFGLLLLLLLPLLDCLGRNGDGDVEAAEDNAGGDVDSDERKTGLDGGRRSRVRSLLDVY